MKRIVPKIIEFAIVVAIVVAAVAVAFPQSAPTPAQLLESYHSALVDFHKAYLRERLAHAETEKALAFADAANDAYVAANNAPPPVVLVPPPSGAIVLARGSGAAADAAPELVDTHVPYLPTEPGQTRTAVIAWPGGSFDVAAIYNPAIGPWQVEASLDGGPWSATRSGVLWIDGATDGDYQVRVVVFPVLRTDKSTVKPTIVLTRTTSAGVATWTKK